MTREQLVNGLKKRLIDSTLDEYASRLAQGTNKSQRNGRTAEIAEFYNSLNEKEREILMALIRQIEVDTVADFFAFLDGIYWLEGQTKDVMLTCLENPEEKLNEDLTDTFLNMVYTWDR